MKKKDDEKDSNESTPKKYILPNFSIKLKNGATIEDMIREERGND